MVQISAAQVKELRDKTGAGMMDCKKALTETQGNIEEAVDWLRKKGVDAAAKKAGRLAADGLIGVAVEGSKGAIVEVNSETDFVARNEVFQKFVSEIAALALRCDGDLNQLMALQFPGGRETVAEELTEMIATIGENLNIRRAGCVSVDAGAVGSYVHNQVAPGLGKIGVLVGVASDAGADTIAEFGKNIAMHVAAAAPLSVGVEDLDPTVVEREKNVLVEQARASGKPENIIEKMVEGRLRKYYEQVVLSEQVYVRDSESRVSEVVDATSKEIGANLQITGFERFALGEGIEK